MNLRKKQVPVVEQATRNVLTPKKKQCKRCGTAHKFGKCVRHGAPLVTNVAAEITMLQSV